MKVNTHRNEADPSRWWGLALLCGAFFVVISAVIVTVALTSKDPGFSLRWGWSAALLSRRIAAPTRRAGSRLRLDPSTVRRPLSPHSPTSPKANRRSLPCSPARAGRFGIPQEQVEPSPVPATEGACEE
jgi:hypothetical protein